MGCYQYPRWCYHNTVWRIWNLIQSPPRRGRDMGGFAGKASPSMACLGWGIEWSFMFGSAGCVAPHWVVTVPVHAVCSNEDRRRRWWRVNYNLMLESNTISPFITPQCHGPTGSHQIVKGTHAEKATPRSVWCGIEERLEDWLEEDFHLASPHLYCDISPKNIIIVLV